MKAYVLIYDEYVHFEVEVACTLLKSAGEVITVGLDGKAKRSSSSFNVLPDRLLSEVDVADVDIFIIPGGDPNSEELRSDELVEFLRDLHEKKKNIAAICSAPIHLAKAGVLDDRKYTTSLEPEEYDIFDSKNFENKDLVVAGNIITAMGTAYVEFGIEIFNRVVGFDTNDEKKSTMDFFKNKL